MAKLWIVKLVDQYTSSLVQSDGTNFYPLGTESILRPEQYILSSQNIFEIASYLLEESKNLTCV
jgi:hypothetical protein